MKKLSTAVKIRRMLVKNHSPKDIALKLNVNVQAVYNMRYKMKQAAAATAPLAPFVRPIPLDVRALPAYDTNLVRRPRGRPRKNPLPIEASARPAPEFTGTITCAAPEPKPLTLWERVRRWWRG
jgi:hypothetical protein